MTLKQKIEQLEQYLIRKEEANKILMVKNEYLEKKLSEVDPQTLLVAEVEKLFNSTLGQAVINYITTLMDKEIDNKLNTFEEYLDERDYLRRIGDEA